MAQVVCPPPWWCCTRIMCSTLLSLLAPQKWQLGLHHFVSCCHNLPQLHTVIIFNLLQKSRVPGPNLSQYNLRQWSLALGLLPRHPLPGSRPPWKGPEEKGGWLTPRQQSSPTTVKTDISGVFSLSNPHKGSLSFLLHISLPDLLVN